MESDAPAHDSPPPGLAAPAPIPPSHAHTASFADWARQMPEAAAATVAWLARPRVRLTLTGLLMLLIGGVMMTNSVWTLPLVLVGATMVAIAWIGRRLDGGFAIEWGAAGAQLEFRAKIAAAPGEPRMLARRPDPEAIDGEAHTVEIDVLELRALIAAADLRPEAATGFSSEPRSR